MTTRTQALDNAQRAADVTGKNYVIHQSRNGQWMYASEEWVNKDPKGYRNVEVVPPSEPKTTPTEFLKITKQLDIIAAPGDLVEVEVNHIAGTMYVHMNGLTVLRIGHVKTPIRVTQKLPGR